MILLAWMVLMNEAVRLNGKQEGDEAGRMEQLSDDRSGIEQAAQKENDDFGEEQAVQVADDAAWTEQEAWNDKKSGGTDLPEIRVLLMDTGYQSYYHSEVRVISDGEEVVYTPDSPELADSHVILPEQAGGIQVLSIERQQGNPSYLGKLEIDKTDQGLLLVNELPLETYLEAVVPSEMPSSYGFEALKAQAVCARTYACRQMQENRLAEYSADVDDSVSFQVYGNIAPQKSTTAAVRATEGQVLCQNGELIQAYYFSTSAGTTSTDEIWGADKPAPYLKAVSCTFDQEEPWSSWSVTIPWSVLAERCNEYQKDIQNVRAAADMGAGNDSDILKSIEIARKNESGAVTGLHVVMNAGSFDLSEEYSIREFLSPKGFTIMEHDGSEAQGGTLLPSAYFTLDIVYGESVTIKGRGFGHGVGMSQTAANKMAIQGYTCREILDYFFKNIEIQPMSETNMHF